MPALTPYDLREVRQMRAELERAAAQLRWLEEDNRGDTERAFRCYWVHESAGRLVRKARNAERRFKNRAGAMGEVGT